MIDVIFVTKAPTPILMFSLSSGALRRFVQRVGGVGEPSTFGGGIKPGHTSRQSPAED